MRLALIAVAVCACANLAFAAPAIADSPLKGLSPAQQPQLKSIYSTVHSLDQFTKKSPHGLALVFLGTKCPVARQYVPRLRQLAAEFQSQGVQFLGVYADAGINVMSMAAHAHDEDISFPVVLDTDHKLADILEVSTTPEAVVLNGKLERHYQGAIDNQFARHGRRLAASENYLQDALMSLVRGQSAPTSFVPASGCPLERQAPAGGDSRLTFHKDIAPLVQKRCQACHREGGVAPFELLSFSDVAYNAEKIREVVSDRRMPPWHADLSRKFGHLKNDQRLTEDELATLVSWIDAGAPEGNRAHSPPPVHWPAAGDWEIGKPDFVYRMPQPFLVPKSGALEYQFFRVKLDFSDDRWFRAVEIKPGNAEVVHHITLHLAPSLEDKPIGGLTTMALLYGLNGERAHLINDFLPGDAYNAVTYPPEQAVRIPKHMDLIFEVHYTPNNRSAVPDQSMVGFRWADVPPEKEVQTIVFRKPIGGFRIPPRDHHHRMEDSYYFKHDVDIDAIRPHFHWRGKSYRLEMIERDPQTDEVVSRQTILSIPVFDQAWQRTYELAQPLRIRAGVELLATGHFDNSAINPNNPNPDAEVHWGQQSSDEMFSTRFKYRFVDTVGQ